MISVHRLVMIQWLRSLPKLWYEVLFSRISFSSHRSFFPLFLHILLLFSFFNFFPFSLISSFLSLPSLFLSSLFPFLATSFGKHLFYCFMLSLLSSPPSRFFFYAVYICISLCLFALCTLPFIQLFLYPFLCFIDHFLLLFSHFVFHVRNIFLLYSRYSSHIFLILFRKFSSHFSLNVLHTFLIFFSCLDILLKIRFLIVHTVDVFRISISIF